MSLEIRLLSYKGNGTQGERIVRTTFRGKKGHPIPQQLLGV